MCAAVKYILQCTAARTVKHCVVHIHEYFVNIHQCAVVTCEVTVMFMSAAAAACMCVDNIEATATAAAAAAAAAVDVDVDASLFISLSSDFLSVCLCPALV